MASEEEDSLMDWLDDLLRLVTEVVQYQMLTDGRRGRMLVEVQNLRSRFENLPKEMAV
jgi:hypothetical protein